MPYRTPPPGSNTNVHGMGNSVSIALTPHSEPLPRHPRISEVQNQLSNELSNVAQCLHSEVAASFPGLRGLNAALQNAPPFQGNGLLAFTYMKAVVCDPEGLKKRLETDLKANIQPSNDELRQMNQDINVTAGLDCARDETPQRKVWDRDIQPKLYALARQEVLPKFANHGGGTVRTALYAAQRQRSNNGNENWKISVYNRATKLSTRLEPAILERRHWVQQPTIPAPSATTTAPHARPIYPAPTGPNVFSNPQARPPIRTEIIGNASAWDPGLQGVAKLSGTLSEIWAKNKKTGNMEIHTCFYQPASPLSNWHHSPFTDKFGEEFSCMEEYLFVQKYRRCGRYDLAANIKDAPNAAAQKDLNKQYGRERQISQATLQTYWFGQGQETVLKEGLEASFTDNRNREKLAVLLLTKGPLLEAAADDEQYGCKAELFIHDPRAPNRGAVNPAGVQAIRDGTWTGHNKLGDALTHLRDNFREPHQGFTRDLQDTYRAQYKPDNFG